MSSELKSVTSSTSFRAVRVFDQGMERNAMIDQDGQIVGLVERDGPYFINGSFTDACKASNRGLRSGACYRGYPCTSFGQFHFVLDKTLEPITDFSDIPEVREVQDLANEAISISLELKGRKCSNTPLLPDEKIIN